MSVSAENVSKLKKLEYLNLALNNIEVIENLEGDFDTLLWFMFLPYLHDDCFIYSWYTHL